MERPTNTQVDIQKNQNGLFCKWIVSYDKHSSHSVNTKDPIHLEQQPLVLALRACRGVIGVGGGRRGGWVFNGMRISIIISSPNSKQEFFYFLFIMFEIFIFIFFPLCLPKRAWSDEKLVGEHLAQVQEYN